MSKIGGSIDFVNIGMNDLNSILKLKEEIFETKWISKEIKEIINNNLKEEFNVRKQVTVVDLENLKFD